MKKKSIVVTCLLLVVAMMISLCACGSTYSKIKSAFEKEGYTESESLSAIQSDIASALGDDYESACTVHALTKGSGIISALTNTVVIFEFTSTEKMEEMYEESDTLKGLISDISKSDYVNGNCLLFSGSSEQLEIFKNA